MTNDYLLKVKNSKNNNIMKFSKRIKRDGFIGQKLLFIFASFDRDEIVDDYVVYYVKKLSELGDVIFVSDNNLNSKEKSKIKEYTIKIIAKRHKKYDFGSYSIGIKYAQKEKMLEKYDWVVICNDSVYGPIFPLEKILGDIRTKDADVWGFTKNNLLIPHIQSYFVILSRKVITDKQVLNFFKDVKKQKNRDLVVYYYEIGLSALFSKCGYTFECFFKQYTSFKCDPLRMSNNINLVKKGFPFIKKRNLIECPCILNTFGFKKVKKISPGYPLDIIRKNVCRFSVSKNPKLDLLIFYFRYSIFFKGLKITVKIMKNRFLLNFWSEDGFEKDKELSWLNIFL